ncbi:alpha/beta fold hydrolase [Hymenobacter cellulosivorans]|uniref:Alpha/beta hydrolase n=1 Tax=Hymenobacter cellulosivorans TaxID=2932249 RepID=A0ABY4FGJ5_9BACT|nr:alpha/beta hydrolase [Hymenobacter cellulosivorans]UOQ55137.1 alpha/beta hydrolase [Hymenobacter cellulosivorans]
MKILSCAVLGAFSSLLMASTPSSSTPSFMSEPTTAPAAGIKNIVLVHGTWADGSSWAKVIPLLTAKGYHVTAVQNPLTSLADDVAATKRAIALQDGPVLLVGHSWGGVVITEAGTDPQVAGLVYVAAAAPEAGQSFLEMAQTGPAAPGNDQIQPDKFGYVHLSPKGIMEDFAQDLSKTEQQVLLATQGPQPFAALQEKVTVPAWKTKPSWYIVAANDRIINPDLERTLAKKINATTTTLPTSHVAMLAQPEKVAAVIIEAASKVVAKK